MIKLIEPIDKKAPLYYIINNSKAALNSSYSDLEQFKEAVIIDSIIYGKENIESGEIEDLEAYSLFDETDVCGGNSRANNKGKIL